VAAEVSPELAVSADADELRARSISQRFLLVELLPDTPGVSLRTIADRVGKLELLPIFAHPERCRALRRDDEPLEDARSNGALVQVVASSLLGRWGPEIAGTAWRLVETGAADLVASDAHHRGHRRALLEAAELVSRRVGEQARRELTEIRPRLAVSGIHPEEARSAR
jgi:protein-tyrosine phosphatase